MNPNEKVKYDIVLNYNKELKLENEAIKRLLTDYKRLLLKSRNKSHIPHKQWKQNQAALIMLTAELGIDIGD